MATETFELISSTTLGSSSATFEITGFPTDGSYSISIRPIQNGSSDSWIRLNNQTSLTHYMTYMYGANGSGSRSGWESGTGKVVLNKQGYSESNPDVVWNLETVALGVSFDQIVTGHSMKYNQKSELFAVSAPGVTSLNSIKIGLNNAAHSYSAGTTIDIYKLTR
tara:strand:- start:561 stop:1055 length:495 start_codon:yes stop_codon:yes gene_type:complete